MTGVGSGVAASIGIGAESTYGTYAAPTRWPEFESETIKWVAHRVAGKGLRAGSLFEQAAQRATTTATVTGDAVMPCQVKGLGQWLGLIFGTQTVTPVQQGSTAAYLQTHVPASAQGQSATIQVGRPTTDGTVHPYNYLGCKVTKAVFEAKLNEPLRLTVTIDGKDFQETTALVSPTFQPPNPSLFWNQGNFQMGTYGSEATVEGVRSFMLTFERPQKVDNFYMDATGRKQEPVQNGLYVTTIELDTDYRSKAAFADVYAADTPQSIILPFTGALIASSYSYGLNFAFPSVRFDNDPPNVNGPEIIMPKMKARVVDDNTHTPMTVTYMSTDTVL